MLETAGSVVEQSVLGQCLREAVGQSEEETEQLFSCYISDMLLFAFELTEDEHEVLVYTSKAHLLELFVYRVAMLVAQKSVLLCLNC